MRSPRLVLATALCALLSAPLQATARDGRETHDAHRFGVIGHSFDKPGDEHFKKALARTSDKSLSFVVVTGIKGSQASPFLLILHYDEHASQQIKGMVKQLPRARIKSKTVQRDGIELTVELRIRESDVDFVDKFLRVQGVYDATLVAHQGDLLS